MPLTLRHGVPVKAASIQESIGIYTDTKTPATSCDRISGITGSFARAKQNKSVNKQEPMTKCPSRYTGNNYINNIKNEKIKKTIIINEHSRHIKVSNRSLKHKMLLVSS